MAAASGRAVSTRMQMGTPLPKAAKEAHTALVRLAVTQHCIPASRQAPGRNRGRCKAALQQTRVPRIDTSNSTLINSVGFLNVHTSCKQLSNAREGRLAFRTEATRKGSKAVEEEEEDWDPDFVEAMNQLCNKAIRVMLSEDLQQVNQLRTELDETGTTLVEHGEIDAARFVLVVQEMLEHTLAPERKLLKGRFNAAFEKIFGLVEDAGWSLQTPEQAAESAGEVYESDDDVETEESIPTERVNEPYNRTFQAHDQFV